MRNIGINVDISGNIQKRKKNKAYHALRRILEILEEARIEYNNNQFYFENLMKYSFEKELQKLQEIGRFDHITFSLSKDEDILYIEATKGKNALVIGPLSGANLAFIYYADFWEFIEPTIKLIDCLEDDAIISVTINSQQAE